MWHIKISSLAVVPFWTWPMVHFEPCRPSCFHFGLLGLCFLSFWPFGPWFPFIVASWAVISFYFGLFKAGPWAPPHKLPGPPSKIAFLHNRFNCPGPPMIFGFFGLLSLLCLHFVSFGPFGLSFSVILAFWAFISFHFGLLGLDFLSLWPLGPWFPCILAFSKRARGIPPTSYQAPRQKSHFYIIDLTAPGFPWFLDFLAFWAFCAFISFYFGLLGSFGFVFSILAFWTFISFHFGLLGLHFLSFWPFRVSFPFILAF